MLLYHGTAAKHLGRILTHGICPRKQKPSNWDQAPSRPDMVYLTVAYPLYFAASAGDKRIAVLEIDSSNLDDSLFYPDEDFVVLVLHRQLGGDFRDLHREVRKTLDHYRSDWKQSLAHLGNCCYRGAVPPAALVRYCVFDTSVRPELAFDMLNPSISMENYRFMGRYYRDFVAWMFGDLKEHPVVRETRAYPDEFPDRKKRLSFWQAQSEDRTGIEVVEVRR